MATVRISTLIVPGLRRSRCCSARTNLIFGIMSSNCMPHAFGRRRGNTRAKSMVMPKFRRTTPPTSFRHRHPHKQVPEPSGRGRIHQACRDQQRSKTRALAATSCPTASTPTTGRRGHYALPFKLASAPTAKIAPMGCTNAINVSNRRMVGPIQLNAKMGHPK